MGREPSRFRAIRRIYFHRMQLFLISVVALSTMIDLATALVVRQQGVTTLIQSEWASPRFSPCLQAEGNWDGAGVVTASCNNFHTKNETWHIVNAVQDPNTGEISGPPGQFRLFGDKCLDVTDGVDNDGTRLQVWKCGDNSNGNQQFQLVGGTITWVGHNKCLDITNGNVRDPVVPTQIWTCIPNINQEWALTSVRGFGTPTTMFSPN